ncbi:MAG: DUF4339 domain-containing protein [Verrucomicrobia bacterium]|nr:DUF4339 domain-containing protein [Verrucomicrobiota bacterium]
MSKRPVHAAHYSIREALVSLAESPRELDGDLNEVGFPTLARALSDWSGSVTFSRLPLHGGLTIRLWLDHGIVRHVTAGEAECATLWEAVEALCGVQLAEAGSFDLDPFVTLPSRVAGVWPLGEMAEAVEQRCAAILALAARVADVRALFRWTARRLDPATLDDPALARFVSGSNAALLAGVDAATLARRQGVSLRQALAYLSLLVNHGSIEPFEAEVDELTDEPLDGVSWFYRLDDGTELGPSPDRELFSMVAARQVSAEALVWRNGQSMWMPYRTARAAALKERALKATAMLRQSPCGGCGKVFREAAMTFFTGHLLCAPCRQRFVAGKPLAPTAPAAELKVPLTASIGQRLRKIFGG